MGPGLDGVENQRVGRQASRASMAVGWAFSRISFFLPRGASADNDGLDVMLEQAWLWGHEAGVAVSGAIPRPAAALDVQRGRYWPVRQGESWTAALCHFIVHIGGRAAGGILI
ncbi:hypothetical protein Ct61P_07624 [Colletotrichum tofieldiae]|nr:hypothetical protein Ct61P_07624 [Colletotrichum tofieldiae]